MKTLKRIIVGHDFRAGGEVAVQSAAALAKRCGAALRLVHVIEPLDTYQRISHPLTSPYPVEEIAQKIGASLQALVAGAELAGLEAEYEVRTGSPFVELILAQRAWFADMITVGGASQPEEPSATTSERLMRKADVPIMVAKSRLSDEAKTFLVPTDFSTGAREAAEQALMLAENFRGRVVFLHVFDQPSYRISYVHQLGVSLPTSPPTPEQMEPEWEDFLSGLHLEKVDWEKSSTEGKAATAIIRQAEQIKADVIVMGTHGRSGLPYILLGSVAEKVARAASCPVLTIRPEAFQFRMP
ncbi:MAG TPA: universal stress protein [Candidatus Binatia bacterium]|nr:universal stress protein [Candidatus Binatia bacterium]